MVDTFFWSQPVGQSELECGKDSNGAMQQAPTRSRCGGQLKSGSSDWTDVRETDYVAQALYDVKLAVGFQLSGMTNLITACRSMKDLGSTWSCARFMLVLAAIMPSENVLCGHQ